MEERAVFNSRVKHEYKKTHTPQCRRCGAFAPWGDGRIVIHHIKALMDGGGNEEGNLCTLCFQCHAEWHTFWDDGEKDFMEFLQSVPAWMLTAVISSKECTGAMIGDLVSMWGNLKDSIMVMEPYKDERLSEYTKNNCANWVDW